MLKIIKSLFVDGYKPIGFIAPGVSITSAVCKYWWESQLIWLQELSYAWAFLPLLVWVFIAYVRRLKQFEDSLNKLDVPLLFTESNPSASIYDIALALERHLGWPINKVFSLLLKGYWRGDLENKETKGPDRLTMLKSIHNNEEASNSFIFAYTNEPEPITTEDDGSIVCDMRPVIPVLNRDTNNWTINNCQKAFEKLANQPANYNFEDLWPEYIPKIIKPGFMAFQISKKLLTSFLKKEKVI